MAGKNIHRMTTTVLSLSMAIVGLILIGQALGAGGTGVIARLILGVLFVAAGCGRLYLLARKSRGA